MKFTKDMRDCVKMYNKMLKDADVEIMNWVHNVEYSGSPLQKQKVAEAKDKKNKTLSDAIKEIDTITANFKKEINDRYMPKGEDLTPDVAIFQSDIKLTNEELNNYAEKYKDNLTMLRYIRDYVNNTPDVDMKPIYFSKEEKLIGADRLATYCKSAITDYSYEEAVFENDDNFKKITSGVLENE